MKPSNPLALTALALALSPACAQAGEVWTPTLNLEGYAVLYSGSNNRLGSVGAKATLATHYLERWRLRGSVLSEAITFKTGSTRSGRGMNSPPTTSFSTSSVTQTGFSLGGGVNLFSDSPAGVWALDGDLFKIDNNDTVEQTGNLTAAAVRLSFSDRGGRGTVGMAAARSHYGDLGLNVNQGDLGGRLNFDVGTYLALNLRAIDPGTGSPTLAYMGEVGWTTASGTMALWGRAGVQQYAVDALEGWIVNLADRQKKGAGLQWRGNRGRSDSWKIGVFWEELSPVSGGSYNALGGSASLVYVW